MQAIPACNVAVALLPTSAADDQELQQGYFHCGECGICRVGGEDNYFHCSACKCCLKLPLLENHVHQPNCLDKDCPVCHESMFDSQKPADKLPCGHMAHFSCINSSNLDRNQICSLCTGRSTHTSGCGSSSMATARPYRGTTQFEDRTQQQLEGLVDQLGPDVDRPELSRMIRQLAEVSTSASGHATLQTCPRLFRGLLEKALLEGILSTAAENEAKGRAIFQVVQLLHTSASRRRVLTLNLQRVSIDRVAVAGSMGQKVQVQGMFDVDLVAFVNLPPSVVNSTDLADPGAAQRSNWMQQLRQQLYDFLEEVLPVPRLGRPRNLKMGTTAITYTAPTDHAGVSIPIDILLAPNLATAASGGSRAEAQCKAVLAPLLTAADARVSGSSSGSLSRMVLPSYPRTIWLAESYTEFYRGAAAAGGRILPGCCSTYGRVVTTTVRLVKAWIRKGLQPLRPGFKQFKGFMAGLLVLRAAEQLTSRCSAVHGLNYEGGYVLDLLLVVLEEVQCWAAAAAMSAAGEEVEPVLYTDMAHGKYYSKEQAMALQAILRESSPEDTWGACKGQPVVVHPVDPLCNVFKQQAQFKLWAEFSQTAAELAYDLTHKSWEYIRTQSSLADALRQV